MTNTLAPYAAQVIGKEFGHGEDKNTAAQLVSHAILGATLAYINGGDPTAGGSAAVASEAAANYLTNQLAENYKDDPKYFVNGEFQANLLSETEKAQIRDLTAGIGAVIGGAVGDSSYNAQLAGVIGQNAVENNGFSIIDENYGKVVKENKKEKWSCPTGYVCPIPEKTLGQKAVLVINDLTLKQIAAVLGAEYDPLTKEKITPKEREDAKVAMLGLGFSKTLNGPIKLTDNALIAIEKKYGTTIAESISERSGNIFSPSSKNPLAKDAISRNTDRLVLSQGNAPTCGHNSCAMVLDTLGKPVNVESLIATLKPTNEGILSRQVSNLLSKNNVENLFLNGRTINDISRYTDKGTPVIVRITDSKNPKEFSHFVVVDGITERAGQKVVAIRDPHGKSYFSPLETFKKAFTGEAIIPRNFK